MLHLLFNTRGRLILATFGLMLSILVNGVLAFKVIKGGVDIDVAKDQVETFETVVSRAINGEIAKREGVEYISNYYPAGTRLTAGSHLSQIVEAARKIALEKLTAY